MGEGQLRDWLDALAALGGVVSAAEAVVADAEGERFRHASGYRVGGEPLAPASGARFDLASLTKAWVATLAVALDTAPEAERIRLDDTLPAGGTLEDLLRHRAGLPAWTPVALRFGRRLGDRAHVVERLLADRPAPPGTYSDLDYLLWGLMAEERTGRSWTALLDERVARPLGLGPVGERSCREPVAEAVECRLDNGKEVELAAAQGLRLSLQRSFLRGVVQDGNARALRAAGIFAAHAGLFATADELVALGREWLRPSRLLAPAAVEGALAGEGPFALGWARWSEDGSSGPALSPRSFGHAGFTGGSLWIDPERGQILVLLAHRLRSAIDFNPFRREFHRLAAAL
jgi:CubicO group peptidase (beta-lactamase class C family)